MRHPLKNERLNLFGKAKKRCVGTIHESNIFPSIPDDEQEILWLQMLLAPKPGKITNLQ